MATATADMEQMLGMTPSDPAAAGIGSLSTALGPAPEDPMMPDVEDPMMSGAEGGLESMAQRLAAMGRGGDALIAHMTPGELVVPGDILNQNPEVQEMIFAEMRLAGIENPEQYIVGSEANSINPETGLPEFFFKKVFRSVRKAVKNVANVVKKAAPLVVPIAINMIAPGLGAVASGALGAGIGTLVQGGDLKDAFKSALIGGAMGGLYKGIGAGFEAYKGGASFGDAFSAGTKAIGQDLQGFQNTLQSGDLLKGGVFDSPTGIAPSGMGTPEPIDAVDGVGGDTFSPEARQALMSNPSGAPTNPTQALDVVKSGGVPPVQTTGSADLFAAGSTPVQTTGSADLFAAGSAPTTSPVQYAGQSTTTPPGSVLSSTASTPIPLDAPPLSQTLPDYKTVGNLENVTGGPRSYLQQTGDVLFSGGNSPGDIARMKADAYAAELAATGDKVLARQAYNSAGPGIMARFGPSTALAAGAAYAGGMFDTPPDEPPYQDEQFQQTRYFDMTPEERAKYRVAQLYGTQGSTGPTVVQSDYGMFGYNPYMYYTQPAMFRRPTYAAMGGEMTSFPRMNGSIAGPGTETSDDVPAMLSDGEFVMTAKAVRGAGNGSREQGIKTMYDMMSQFEGMVA